MKRIFITICALFSLLYSQANFAGPGALFNVATSGTPGNVSIDLCLNGKGPVSCQTYTLTALTLTITTTTPRKTYPYAGIKINTPGFTIANIGATCTPISNGYCLFSVSSTSPIVINLVGKNTLAITPSTLLPASLGSPYSQTIQAHLGFPPYSYKVSSGTLPTGLSLNTSTGLLSGTPTVWHSSATSDNGLRISCI